MFNSVFKIFLAISYQLDIPPSICKMPHPFFRKCKSVHDITFVDQLLGKHISHSK